MISEKTFIRLAWKYSKDNRIKALVNFEDRTLESPMPPIPVYTPVGKEKWSLTAVRAFAHGLLP